jgi:hypothetical protein
MMAHLPVAQQGKKPSSVVFHSHENDLIHAGNTAREALDRDEGAKLDAWACEACILRIGRGTGINILSHFTMERESGLQAIP